MNLEENYQLLEIVSDDGIRTHKAREIASGRGFEVHLFMKPEDHAAFERLRELPLSVRRPLLEFGSQLKIPYIITDPLPGETNARSWFTTLLMPAQNSPEPKPQPIKAAVWKTGTPLPDPLFPDEDAAQPAGASGEPGEFTRMFRAPSSRPEEKAKEESPQPEASKTEAPEPAASDVSGEFTRMFKPAERAAETIPGEPPVKAPSEGAGEIARMFQAAASAPAPKPPAAPEPVPADEAVTRVFQLPTAPTQAAPSAPTPRQDPGEFTQMIDARKLNSEPSSKPEPDGPGEFTRMFESPRSPGVHSRNPATDPISAPPVQPPLPSGQSEFTRMFGNSSAGVASTSADQGESGGGSLGGSATGTFAPRPVSAPRVPTGKSNTPSEYTQMMSRSSAPTLGQGPPEHQTPDRAARSNMPLWIVLGSLSLFAILIIVFFALRR